MIDVNPVDVAVDMLREALPGFATKIDPAIDSVVIHGALPIAAKASTEQIRFLLYRPGYFEAPLVSKVSMADEALIRARQTEALKRELEPMVSAIVENIQRRAIEAVGLEAEIRRREERARIDGRRFGFIEGKIAGRREGRQEILAELAELAQVARGDDDE